jgi:hypothetical protein
MAQQPPVGQVLPTVKASQLYSDTPHTARLVRHTTHWTSGQTHHTLDEWSARSSDPYLTTQYTQQTDIHAHEEIQTRNPNKLEAADQRRRPRGQ